MKITFKKSHFAICFNLSAKHPLFLIILGAKVQIFKNTIGSGKYDFWRENSNDIKDDFQTVCNVTMNDLFIIFSKDKRCFVLNC